MESMLIAREERENIIGYIYYSKNYHVIRNFPDLNQTFGKEDISLFLYLKVQEKLNDEKPSGWIISVCESNRYRPVKIQHNKYKGYQLSQYF